MFLLDGRGWGHGVGMSQWGAEGYARHGFGYRQILAHYYPQTHDRDRTARDRFVCCSSQGQRRRCASALPRRSSSSTRAVASCICRRGRSSSTGASCFAISICGRRSASSPARSRCGSTVAGYRGASSSGAEPDGLMVVNVLPLDRYLRGVVPWEVPKGWHEATYEAQAVAARSYTLATVHPGKDFDLFPDQRSQMYGGIRAERAADEPRDRRDRRPGARLATTGSSRRSTSRARAAERRPCTTRGRAAQQVPYLVSVADPYDYISPHHVWPTAVLSAARVADVLQRARRARRASRRQLLRPRAGRTRADGGRVEDVSRGGRPEAFALGSTDFQVRVLSLDAPAHARSSVTASRSTAGCAGSARRGCRS